LRDPEAFTLFQKGQDYYERAHGEMDQHEGLRLANEYFEQVMDRVPEYWGVYVAHSDRYAHMLNDIVVGQFDEDVTDETLAEAYQSMLADYEAAGRYAPTQRQRYLIELDLAFLSGNWRGLTGRLEKALAEPGCNDGNWTATVANVLGYAAEYAELAEQIVACDPLRTLAWFNASRSRLWAGDAAGALAEARKGTLAAPGNWLRMTLLQTLLANNRYDEALQLIHDEIPDEEIATIFQIMALAHRGDRDRLTPLLEKFDEGTRFGFFVIGVNAWTGRRNEANRYAAQMDGQLFGANVLWQLVQWCQCGAPWELDATPNFAAKIGEANLTWPPVSPLSYPLKDW